MDIATLVGLITCGVMVFLGIVTGPEKMAGFRHFYDLTSIFITLGGSVSCMIIQSKSFGKFIEDIKSIRLAMKVQQAHEAEVIRNIINLSNVARKEGLLALEEAANNIEDDFLKKGIMLIVDGTDPELVRSIMLYNMDDMSTIGPNMAVALLTTLYGSLLANWLCVPISFKLKMNNELEIKMKEVMVEGLLSIQAGENPRVIEEKLKSFLAPSVREQINEQDGAAEGGEA